MNLANSGSYQVGFSLSGTLDPNDTVRVVAVDGSGNTATGSFVSPSGGESTGSVLLNMSTGGLVEGGISFNGVVYSGGVATQVVASGMALTGMLDRTSPTITLSSTAPSAITGAITVSAVISETASGFAIGDVTVTNGTATGLVQSSGTGYSFMVTPSVSTGTLTLSVGTGTFADLAGNPNTSMSNTLSFSLVGTGTTGSGDTTPPVIAITSHSNNAIVSGFPTLTGTVSDSG